MAGWTYVDAGMPEYPFQLRSITVSPDPPEPGKDLEYTIRGQLAAPLAEGAYVDVQVRLGLVKLLTRRLDLCEELRRLGVKTPMPAGDFELVRKVALPREIPQAKFKISANGYTANDEDLFDVNIFVDFMKRFPAG